MTERALPATAPLPAAMAELTEAEHLIAWALRHWVLGLRSGTSRTWTLVWNEFARRLGAADGKAALSALLRLIAALQEHAHRPLHVHRPCCPCLDADEFSLVALVAACQKGRWPLARTRAEWLADGNGVGDLLEAGDALGRALARHAPRLPERTDSGPAFGPPGATGGPGLATVH